MATHHFRRSLAERFRDKVYVDVSTGCWLWTAAISGGYGRIADDTGRIRLAHHVAYELYIGPIPAGRVLDHICRVRRCVNPQHLEAVTLRIKAQRTFERGVLEVQPVPPLPVFASTEDGRRRYGLGKHRKMPLIERFMMHISTEPFSGCWLFMGTLDTGGYGMMLDDQQRRRHAHCVAHELFIGPIPAGYHVDHKCRNRICCAPNHIEAVTHQENLRRGRAAGFGGLVGFRKASANRRARTHCQRGHEYNEANTRMYRGKRLCKACQQFTRHIRKSNKKALDASD